MVRCYNPTYPDEDPCTGGGGSRLEERKDSTITAINIYPSPSNGLLNIENNLDEDVVLDITMINGTSIVKSKIKALNKLQLNDLPPGIVIVKVVKITVTCSKEC